MVQNGPKLESPPGLSQFGTSMGPFYQVILWNALFSPQSLKVPKEECNKFTLFTTVLFDNMWRIQNQTTFVCHILVPKMATEKIKKAYFDHIVAMSALKSPVATKWLPPPPNWVKINFDVAMWSSGNYLNLEACNSSQALLCSVWRWF